MWLHLLPQSRPIELACCVMVRLLCNCKERKINTKQKEKPPAPPRKKPKPSVPSAHKAEKGSDTALCYAFSFSSSPSTLHVRVPSPPAPPSSRLVENGEGGIWETLEGISPTTPLLCAPPGRHWSVTQPGGWRDNLSTSRSLWTHSTENYLYPFQVFFFLKWEALRLLHRNSWWLKELRGQRVEI